MCGTWARDGSTLTVTHTGDATEERFLTPPSQTAGAGDYDVRFTSA